MIAKRHIKDKEIEFIGKPWKVFANIIMCTQPCESENPTRQCSSPKANRHARAGGNNS